MVDPLDEICSQSIVDFEGFKLVDINKAGLELGERVQKVQVGERLVSSPATLVQGEWGMSPMMQRYMKSQTTSSASDSAFAIGSRNQAILEINPQNSVIKLMKNAMETAPDADETEDMVMMLYETAALIGGYTIEDPADFAKRVTRLMETMDPGASGDAGHVDAEVVS